MVSINLAVEKKEVRELIQNVYQLQKQDQ